MKTNRILNQLVLISILF